MSEAAKGAGDVQITLDGTEYTLRPTLQACIGISKLGGGLTAAVARCQNFDFDTISEIISFGLDATSSAQKKQVNELIYKTGLFEVAPMAIRFIRVIGNGGRMPDEADEAAAADVPLEQATD